MLMGWVTRHVVVILKRSRWCISDGPERGDDRPVALDDKSARRHLIRDRPKLSSARCRGCHMVTVFSFWP